MRIVNTAEKENRKITNRRFCMRDRRSRPSEDDFQERQQARKATKQPNDCVGYQVRIACLCPRLFAPAPAAVKDTRAAPLTFLPSLLSNTSAFPAAWLPGIGPGEPICSNHLPICREVWVEELTYQDSQRSTRSAPREGETGASIGCRLFRLEFPRRF